MSFNILLQSSGKLVKAASAGFLLLAVGSGAEAPVTGGGLGWYYRGPDNQKKIEQKFEEEFVDVLEEIGIQENVIKTRPEFIRQRDVVAQNILRKMREAEALRSSEIQKMIMAAEAKYYERLAMFREQEDETALLLLLN